MERVNVIGVETLYGLRTLELFIGDVTTVPCDILAVSAFKGGYSPIPRDSSWEPFGMSWRIRAR